MKEKPSVVSFVLDNLFRAVETTRVRVDEVGGMHRLAIAIFEIDTYSSLLTECKLTEDEVLDAKKCLIALIDQSKMIPEVTHELDYCLGRIKADYDPD